MTTAAPSTVRLPTQVHQAIITHAAFCHPLEACGLLATDAHGDIRFVYALTNRAASPVRYVVDPTEHFRAIQHAEAAGWTIGGVFHSHPSGPAAPSPVDVADALEPSWIYLVATGHEVTAWSVDKTASQLSIELV